MNHSRKGKNVEAHAYLLPLLASPSSSPHSTSLSHFIEYFVPLSERMFEYKMGAESKGEKGAAEVKMWNVLISQVWACFAGFVDYRSSKGSSLADEIVKLQIGGDGAEAQVRTSLPASNALPAAVSL